MSTDSTQQNLGDNARERLVGFARMISDHLNEIADHQEKVKSLKAEAKSVGFDLKVLGQIIKEQRKGAKYQADQLQLEMVLDTYRGAVGLPRDLETAQKLAAEEAEKVPEKPKRGSKTPANDDGDKHERTVTPRKDLN